MLNTEQPIFFNVKDVEEATKDKFKFHGIMYRIGHKVTSFDKMVLTKETRHGKEIEVLRLLKHYELNECIKTYSDILEKDKRRHALESRAKILKILKQIQKNKLALTKDVE